jgi:hypothetical protein
MGLPLMLPTHLLLLLLHLLLAMKFSVAMMRQRIVIGLEKMEKMEKEKMEKEKMEKDACLGMNHRQSPLLRTRVLLHLVV